MAKKYVAGAVLWVSAWCSCQALAQDVGPTALSNGLRLSSQGVVEVVQDRLVLTLGTTREGADGQSVQQELSRAVDQALQQARSAAVAGQMDVRTGGFSLSPRYGQDGRITGWRGSAEVVLEGLDMQRITATAARMAPLNVLRAAFALSREARERAETQAQALAVERFKTRATELTRLFGFGSFGLREVSVEGNDQTDVPRLRTAGVGVAMSASMAEVPVQAGITQVMVQVSGTVQMR